LYISIHFIQKDRSARDQLLVLGRGTSGTEVEEEEKERERKRKKEK